MGGVLSGGETSSKAWTSVVHRVLPSIYKIKVAGCDFNGSGSGFRLGKWIVTNRHVVENAKTVSYVDASGRTRALHRWYSSRSDDLAIISSLDQTEPSLGLASGPAVGGDLVATGGYPLGGPQVSNRGRVIQLIPPLEPNESKTKVIETSAAILPGDSGGPLLNVDGLVVGAMFALNLENGTYLAIPAARIEALLKADHSHPEIPAECN